VIPDQLGHDPLRIDPGAEPGYSALVRCLLLACDYDGTIATQGQVDVSTIGALERLRASGRSLVLVTGRRLEDLLGVCPRVDLFDRVVAENGALLFRPWNRTERVLGEPPPPSLIEELSRRGVADLSIGRVIIATRRAYEDTVIRTIRDLGLLVELSLNKGAVMVLPYGVNKATGLRAALDELGRSARETVGVGDAENDQPFLALCGYSVAVTNALPALKQRVDYVTEAADGAGVVELIRRLLASDPAQLG
jgi:hydroxymethylpyrimidine pyrophosphatase-like HAD family hydrolase